jgi:hypothetical protein
MESDFYTLRPVPPCTVHGVSGSSIAAIRISSIHLIIAKGIHLTLDNVLFIPTATVHLISISAICAAHHCIASFHTTSCWVQGRNDMHMLTGTLTSHCLYALSDGQLSTDHALLTTHQPDFQSWHRHLGHTHYHAVYDLAHSGNATDMPINLSTQPPVCDNCVLGKQTKSSIPKVRAEVRANRQLGIVHVDLMGHLDVVSATGHKYIMDIIDDFLSYSRAIPLTSKSDAFPLLVTWECACELKTGLKVGIYHSDNGELKSDAMHEWLLMCGTQHQFMAPYTSAQNGRVKCLHHTLMGHTCAMQSACKIPPNSWDEFVLTTCYLSNRTPITSQSGHTPFEQWYG